MYRHFASGGASKIEHREINSLQREKNNHRGVDFELKLVEGKVTGMADFLAWGVSYPLHIGTNSF